MSQKEREELEKQVEDKQDYGYRDSNDVFESEKMQSPEPWPEPPESDSNDSE